MGLLDGLMSDDARLGIGLLAAGGYQPTKMSFGQRVAQALQGEDARKQEALKAGLLKMQMDSAKGETEYKNLQRPLLLSELELKNQQHKLRNALTQQEMGGGVMPAAGAVDQSGVAPTGQNMAVSPTAQPVQGGSFENDLRIAQAWTNLDPPTARAKFEGLKLKYPDLKEHQGILYNARTGQVVTTMPFGTATGNVIQYQPQAGGGLGVSSPAGANDVLRQQARIKAEEEARFKPFQTEATGPTAYPLVRPLLDVLQPSPSAPAIAQLGNPQQRQVALPSDSQFMASTEFAAMPPAQQQAIRDIASGKKTSVATPAVMSDMGKPLVPGMQPQIAQLPQPPANATGMTPNSKAIVLGSEAAAKDFIAQAATRYDALKDVPATLTNIEAAKDLIKGAKGFMGPAGESLLTAAKFLNNRLGTSINTEGVKDAEELRSRIFIQIMDNLKKMDASPSQQQQQIMQQALGTLGTDPNALPRVLDTFSDLLKNKVKSHNEMVQSAESRGVQFPYDIKIKPAAMSREQILKQYGIGVTR